MCVHNKKSATRIVKTKLMSRSIKLADPIIASLPTKKMTQKLIIIDLVGVYRRRTNPYKVPNSHG